MSCTFPPRLTHDLTRVSVSLLVVVPSLLGPITPPVSIAATVPREKALAIDRTVTVQEQPTPNPQPVPREPPSTGLPTHLSGASLLFVIWLVAEQVSADWYGAIEADEADGQAP